MWTLERTAQVVTIARVTMVIGVIVVLFCALLWRQQERNSVDGRKIMVLGTVALLVVIFAFVVSGSF
jgi:hypothetical protein